MKTCTLILPKNEVAIWNKILQRKTPYQNYGSTEIMQIYTAKFDDGYEVDLKICNGKGPFLDPVLFDNRGYEVECLDCSDHLNGVYEFNAGYILTVEVTDR